MKSTNNTPAFTEIFLIEHSLKSANRCSPSNSQHRPGEVGLAGL